MIGIPPSWREPEDPAESVAPPASGRCSRLNPRKVPSGPVPVCMRTASPAAWSATCSAPLSAAAVARGTSFLKDSWASACSVPKSRSSTMPPSAPRPRLQALRRRRAGHPPTPLVAEGASSAGCSTSTPPASSASSTGHASRGTSGPPSPSPPTSLGGGAAQSAGADARTWAAALLVTELIGMGVNGVTGDTAAAPPASGSRTAPSPSRSSEITIASNLKTMFRDLEAADDLERRGAINAPSLLVPEMTIAGT